jgi:hypothetical protein
VSLTDQLPSTTCTNSTLLATLADFTEQIRNRVKNAEPLALDLRTTYTLVELFVGFREANATTPANSRQYLRRLLQAVSMSAGIDATINALLEIDTVDPATGIRDAWYIAYECLEALEEWPSPTIKSPLFGLLDRELYEAIDRYHTHDRHRYLRKQLLSVEPSLTTTQLDLAKVLAPSWEGTLPSLAETLRTLRSA